MNEKLNLNSKYTYGKWYGKTVEEIINTEWGAFNYLFDRHKDLYTKEVIEYYIDKKIELYNPLTQEIKTFINLENT